ncbi:hypothetical protein OG864_05710 [Streptomyces sp. NBC_00124]|uniref:hypothetical protein n=1 Tax=Streptomyces sp. NBC_00124 TaxID=2975662 RepID=UPI0022509271|nr:hypothetical protein [Streptomyces sp. NBC_00124]MCX5358191.1 hypothetical protein [Streptomyces sp. NBC_00124]
MWLIDIPGTRDAVDGGRDVLDAAESARARGRIGPGAAVCVSRFGGRSVRTWPCHVSWAILLACWAKTPDPPVLRLRVVAIDDVALRSAR